MKSSQFSCVAIIAAVIRPCDSFTPGVCRHKSVHARLTKTAVNSAPPQENEVNSWTSSTPGGRTMAMPDLEMIKYDLESAKLSGQKALDAVPENIQQGEFGERGEQYVVAQFFLILCILGGGLPFIGDLLYDIFGPILFISGILVAGTAVVEVEEGLTPFPVTNQKSKLRTGGIYRFVRHPMYTGLLMTMMGGSIMTDSASRVLLTIGLYSILYAKVDFEEKDLINTFPEYATYKENVRGKFLPAKWTDKLLSSLNLEKKSPDIF